MAKSILICDDAAFMRMMIKDILIKNGYAIAGEAENGLKAVEKYMETKPDLVLMDITMPEMDGIQALKKIKSSDPNASVVMCSAMGQQAMVIESFRVDSTKLILIVQIAGEYYALAYSRDNVTLIDKLNPDEINNLKAENSSKSNNKLDFKEILSQIKNKNSKDDSDIK